MNDTDDAAEVTHTFSRKRTSKTILLHLPSKVYARKSDSSKSTTSRKRSNSTETTEPKKKKARKSNHCDTPTAKSLDALEAQRAFFAAIDSQPLEALNDNQQQDDNIALLHTELSANKEEIALISDHSQNVNRSDLLQQMHPDLYAEYKQYCDVVASILVPMSFEEFMQERIEMPESNSQPTMQDHFV